MTTDVAKTGTIWAYASSDDGRTFSRYKVGTYAALDSTTSWPTVEVAPDGSLWALYVDGVLDANNDPITNKLILFHSTDHGQTWSRKDITPMAGRYEYGWLSVSPDGRNLGLGVYYRPDNNSDWRVYGAVFRPGQKPALVSLDPANPVQDKHCFDANGDLMGSSFSPDGTLSVVWTRKHASEHVRDRHHPRHLLRALALDILWRSPASAGLFSCHMFGLLELQRQTSLPKIDTVAAHGHALPQQQLTLARALGQAAVGADDSVPGQPMAGCQDAPYQARGSAIDVAVGAYEPLGDLADAGNDSRRPGLATFRVGHRHPRSRMTTRSRTRPGS